MRSSAIRCLCHGMATTLLLACAALPASGQTPTGSFTGVVSDGTNMPLAGVEVVSLATNTGYRYATLSDENGRYWLLGLSPGVYDLRALRIGFAETRIKAVVLSVGSTVTVDFTLDQEAIELAGLSVVTGARLVETTQSDVSYTISQAQITKIPEESREFMDLARLAPGATTADQNGLAIPSTSIGALNAFNTGILVDGGNLTVANVNEQAGSIPLLAIQEFEVLTSSYSAEYGQAASGIVNAVTRSGTNQLTTEGFALYRNRRLNALGEFETEKPDFSRTHFGAAVGGPIDRDRTHAFVAFERKVESLFTSVFTGGVFPEIEGTFDAPRTQNLLFGRVDHRVGEDGLATLRYAGDYSEQLTDFGANSACADIGASPISAEEFGVDIGRRMHSLLGSYRAGVGRTGLSETRIHVLRRTEDRARLTIDPAQVRPSGCTGGNFWAWEGQTWRVEAKQDFSVVTSEGLGTHKLKVGAMASWVETAGVDNNLVNGMFIYGSDAAPALPFVYVRNLAPEAWNSSSWQLAGYLQDEWTPTRSLTVQLGLRYDFETNASNAGLVSPNAESLPFVSSDPRPADYNNFSPRIGVAWSPGLDSRTVVRGGFGIFYNQFMQWLAQLETSNIVTGVATSPGTTDPSQITFDPSAPPNATVSENGLQAPLTRQFSLGVERAFLNDLVVRVDGMLVQGRYQPIFRQLQTRPVARYPEYGANVWQLSNRGEAEAKMLILRASKRFGRGSIDVHYTLSDRRTTNESWIEDVPQTDPNSLDFSSEMGPAGWDERHRIVALVDVPFPLGVQVAAKSIYSSARPFNAVTGTDDNQDGRANDRPVGEGRNARRGADFLTIDLGIRRGLFVGRNQFDLIVNVYNVLNRTNFVPQSFVGNLSSDLFGQPFGAYPKAQVEIGVQLRR
jgi:Carboxypeptidase regulatory-like domain/TonB-dependent Receptor Plug Domain/TonB dependent receptor-like, beta-barrel